jgi:hypothetical protein
MDLIAVVGYYTLVAFTLNVDQHPVPGGEEPLGEPPSVVESSAFTATGSATIAMEN